LREGLRELGWVEGRNLLLELRYAEGRPERIGELATQLAGLPVDVIVTAGAPPTLAARKAAPAIPIVAAFVADPVGNGLVTPGGTVAALDAIPTDLTARQVQLLREIMPGITRLGLVSNPGNPAAQRIARRVVETAERDGLRVLVAHAEGAAALEGAFAQLRGEGAQAVLLLGDAGYTPPGQVGQVVRGSGMPTLCPESAHVQVGCLVSYAANGGAMYKQSASYIDRILKGTPPGDLPVGTPARFELVIHGGAAKAMNLKVPPALLQRANAVIE
jgi:putative ABC transport system substrate-binding protein